MDNYFKRVFSQIFDFLKSLSPMKKAAVAVTSVVIIAGLSALFFWAGDRTYASLFSNLSPEESANIIRVLREKKVPFRVDATGKDIMVAPEDLFQLRLELASLGVTQNGTVGYEVFDKQSLGTPSFVQKINQKRALEGELMRTISSIQGVRRSRVHLAIPQKSAFIEDQKKPTASVVLDLDPGARLSDKQINGIGNLVASAIEGMEESEVVIVDSNGKTLSRNNSDGLAAETATQFDFRKKLEGDMERSIEAMLERIVGEGRVVARVSADIDFSQVNETQTLYDQDGSAVLSVQENVKSMEGSRPGPYGVAGAGSNTPGEVPVANTQVRSDTRTSDKVTNYKIPETVRRTIRPAFTTRKMSVAVLVDGKPTKVKGEDGAIVSKTEPWTPEKLKELEVVVASAIGFDAKRGDTLEIKNMEFTRTDFEEAERMIAETERKSYIRSMTIYGVIGLAILLFFLLVVRPFIKWVTENTVDSVDSFLPQTIEELERMQKNAQLPGLEDTIPVLPDRVDPEKVEGEMIKEKIITLVDGNPHKAALVLKDWLHDDAAKRKTGDDGGTGPAKRA